MSLSFSMLHIKRNLMAIYDMFFIRFISDQLKDPSLKQRELNVGDFQQYINDWILIEVEKHSEGFVICNSSVGCSDFYHCRNVCPSRNSGTNSDPSFTQNKNIFTPFTYGYESESLHRKFCQSPQKRSNFFISLNELFRKTPDISKNQKC